MTQNIWQRCLQHLERELPAEDINTWIRPLEAVNGRSHTRLLAPNDYVRDHISHHYLERIRDIFEHLGEPRESVAGRGRACPGKPEAAPAHAIGSRPVAAVATGPGHPLPLRQFRARQIQ